MNRPGDRRGGVKGKSAGWRPRRPSCAWNFRFQRLSINCSTKSTPQAVCSRDCIVPSDHSSVCLYNSPSSVTSMEYRMYSPASIHPTWYESVPCDEMSTASPVRNCCGQEVGRGTTVGCWGLLGGRVRDCLVDLLRLDHCRRDRSVEEKRPRKPVRQSTPPDMTHSSQE